MAFEDYDKALRLGQKEYRARVAKGDYPYLPVLDDILSRTEIESRVDLGLVDIPLELIVGTSTQGRTTAFAGNFMPLLKSGTEFAGKWITLSDQLMASGQREPIKAYEFMNKFYVVEGNKRVSVSKYLNAVSLYGNVTRFVPKRTEDKESAIYFEFLDFYAMTKINYIWFSKKGSFTKMLTVDGKAPDEPWTEDDCTFFRSCYLAFSKEFKKAGGDKLKITPADAMLAYIEIYGYRDIPETSAADMKKNLAKIWDEFLMLEADDSVALLMQPTEEPKKNILSKLIAPEVNIITKIISPEPARLKVAFVYDKSPEVSSWIYGHDLGRKHVEQVFGDKIEVRCVDNVDPKDEKAAMETLENIAADGCDVIFTTTPQLLNVSLKTAVNHPETKVLNCSLNTSHRYIRTYYVRMYEAKFLIGAIAGAMSEDGRIGYIADYPIYGMTANINAFALGAKLVNPRTKIYLEWSTVKDNNIPDAFIDSGISFVSTREMIVPQDANRSFGLTIFDKNHSPVNLAMPVWHWGVLYERLLRGIMSGTWKEEADASNQALNYWWGMSAGAVDVICSQKLPTGTKRLVELLKQTICSGDFNPFSGVLHSQDGVVQPSEHLTLEPEDIIKMDWLDEDIIGSIPTLDELKDEAKPVVLIQGPLGDEKL